MEVRAKTIRISICISGIMLGAIFYIEYCMCGHIKTILFALATGIFVSALMTMSFNLFEYFLVRRKTLEDYWENARIINSAISNIQVLYFPNLVEVKAQIKEIWNDHKKNDHLSYTDKLNTLSSDRCYEDILVQEYKNKIVWVMKSYVDVCTHSFDKMENVYGDIYFLMGNKKRSEIFRTIHEPLRNTYRLIKEKNISAFIPYMNGENNNLQSVLNRINELQSEIFEILKKCDTYSETLMFYNKKFDEMNKNLEKLRAELIYHDQPEYEKDYCRYIVTLALSADDAEKGNETDGR